MHEISAIVGTAKTLSVIERTWSEIVATPLGYGLSIIGLAPNAVEAIGCAFDVRDLEELDASNQLRARVVGLLSALRQGGVDGPPGLIFTQYFGGVGTQPACLVERGDIALGPLVGHGSINQVLARLGVQPDAEKLDEFETSGLGRWRSTEDIRASG